MCLVLFSRSARVQPQYTPEPMTIAVVLNIIGFVLLLVGFSRGKLLALVLGGIILAESMALYVFFGPLTEAARNLFVPK